MDVPIVSPIVRPTMFVDDETGATTLPIALVPEVGPLARFMRRLVGWPNPFMTVSIVISFDEHLMIVYREPQVHAADWDIAEGLMHLIAHPEQASRFLRDRSLIRNVDTWDIRQVASARAALERFLDSQLR
jgi:hypothetical protein